MTLSFNDVLFEARPIRPRTMMSIGGEWILLAAGLGLAAAAFLLSACLCGLARRYALRFGFLDRPGGHKGHKAPAPLGGGVAIWLTTMLVLGASGLVVPAGPLCASRGAGEARAGRLRSRRRAPRDPGPGHASSWSWA